MLRSANTATKSGYFKVTVTEAKAHCQNNLQWVDFTFFFHNGSTDYINVKAVSEKHTEDPELRQSIVFAGYATAIYTSQFKSPHFARFDANSQKYQGC